MKHEDKKVTMVVNQIALRCANFEAQFIMAKLQAEEEAQEAGARISKLEASILEERTRRIKIQSDLTGLANSSRPMPKTVRAIIQDLSLR